MRLSAPLRSRISAMHRYRTRTCGALRRSDVGNTVRLSGWVHRVRDHGGLLFIDLRDHYGITQCVADPDSPAFAVAETLRSEWVVRVDGEVKARPGDTVNAGLPTGEVELFLREIEVLSEAGELPLPVFGEQDYPEETRLTYRFLDLRRERMHRNILRRSAIISSGKLQSPLDPLGPVQYCLHRVQLPRGAPSPGGQSGAQIPYHAQSLESNNFLPATAVVPQF